MKRYEVLLTRGAEQDLREIHRYVHDMDSPARADRLLDKLLEVAESLATLSERGSHPEELLELGIREFRQVFCEAYRILYRVFGDRAFVYLIADGRRDMQSLLERRLLRG